MVDGSGKDGKAEGRRQRPRGRGKEGKAEGRRQKAEGTRDRVDAHGWNRTGPRREENRGEEQKETILDRPLNDRVDHARARIPVVQRAAIDPTRTMRNRAWLKLK